MSCLDPHIEPAIHHASTVVLEARDCPDLHLVACVEAGAALIPGAPVMRDRTRPAIRVVSPVAGRVERVEAGLGRRIVRVVIGGAARAAAVPIEGEADTRTLMLRYAIWPDLRTRPFDRVPDPDARPDAILVDALDALGVAAARKAPFALGHGLRALRALTDGPVILCQRGGVALSPAEARVDIDAVAPRHDGMAWRLRRLRSVARGGTVWVLGVQATIALGRLQADRLFDPTRLVEIGAAPGAAPVMLRAPFGADMAEALRAAGHEVAGPCPLGHGTARLDPATVRHERPDGPMRPVVPVPALAAALPLGVRSIALLRALQIGDAEAARRLGCLDLVAADMARASAICGSGADYGALLRRVLGALEAGT